MKKLTKTQVILLHNELIRESGGSSGLRDEGLLESALAAPFMSFDGESLYPTVEARAAQLGFGLVQNHPFVDGNKRIGILVMMVYLELNGILLNCSDNELIEIGLSLADGTMTAKQLLQWIIAHN